MKRRKDRILKDELSRLVGAQYATGEEWRNNSRKNEETVQKQKTKQNKTKKTQLCKWLVLEARSNAVKNNMHRSLEC